MSQTTLTGTVLDERVEISLEELSRACATSTEWVVKLVDEGVLEPVTVEHRHWRFSGSSLPRAQIALRLQRDLGVNLPGVALALEMMDEIDSLRAQLRRFDPDASSTR